MGDMEKNVQVLSDFINKRRVIGDDSHRATHTFLGTLYGKGGGGCFCIEDKDYPNFLDAYAKAYGYERLHIVERHNERGAKVGPFIIDIDYKTHKDIRIYNDNHILEVVKIATEIFKKYLDEDDENYNSDSLTAYVCEKPKPSKDKESLYKDGFHIVYNIPLSAKKRLFLYYILLNSIKEKDVFGDIISSSKHENRYEQIVDKCVVISNGLMMYGSSKIDRKPYELTKIYNKKYIEIYKTSDKYKIIDLLNIFSLRNYCDDDDIKFNSKGQKEISILVDQAEEKEKLVKKELSKISNYSNGQFLTMEEIMTKHKDLVSYIDMLKPHRSQDYGDWTRIGWILHGLGENLLELFLHFSKKAPNYDEKSCRKLWTESNKNGVKMSLGTLKMYAKEDNQEMYENFLREELTDMVLKIENQTHEEIARIVHTIYRDRFVCTSLKRETWYYFNNHRWIPDESGISLHTRLQSEVPSILSKLKHVFMSRLTNSTGGKNDNDYKKLLAFNKMLIDFGNNAFSTTIMKVCARHFYVRNFEQTLNSNKYLLGFENGVLDLSFGIDLEHLDADEGKHRKTQTPEEEKERLKKLIVFRDGIPDDRITFSTGYRYEPNPDPKVVQKIASFISKIQPKKEMLDYVMRLFASCLDGLNTDQQFRMFIGVGSNGKSKLVDLLTASLGQYASSMPDTVLTLSEKSPNGASPFLADKHGVRFVLLQEPEGTATIQVGKMKLLTGGDKVSARGLFKDPFEFIPQFKMILVCNKLPKIPSTDRGTWRRIRVTSFPSRFTTNKKDVNEEENVYLADTSINEDQLKRWAPTFIWMLINNYYINYKVDGLQEPKEVLEYTDKYARDNDSIMNFVSMNYTVTGKITDKFKLSDFYSELRDFIKNSESCMSIKFSKREVADYMEEKYKLKISTNTEVMYGIVQKTHQDSDFDEDKEKEEKENEKKKKDKKKKEDDTSSDSDSDKKKDKKKKDKKKKKDDTSSESDSD